ncbi:MAG: hypothetical protein J3R72DRAFT_525148 [Linnemannia gamsii]|nr:MAG: hypothetical protein J3R72DRAFT_525148 [Linnemannia gamsii]
MSGQNTGDPGQSTLIQDNTVFPSPPLGSTTHNPSTQASQPPQATTIFSSDDVPDSSRSRLTGDEEEYEILEGQSGFQNPPSTGSFSTFDLPSPALSSMGAEKNSCTQLDKAGRWVWRWAEKRSDAAGSIQSAMANQGKRSSAHFTKIEFEQHVCKMLVHHKLPYTIIESPFLKRLLHLGHAAPSATDPKFPSNDTITRRNRTQHTDVSNHSNNVGKFHGVLEVLEVTPTTTL